LAPGSLLEARDLGLEELAPDENDPASRRSRPANLSLGDDVSLEEMEREHIARVVARAPSIEAASRTLAIDATTLPRKRQRYALLLSLSGDGARARQELATERRRFDAALRQLEEELTTDEDERASARALRGYVAAYRARGDAIIALDGVAPARELYRRDAAPL